VLVFVVAALFIIHLMVSAVHRIHPAHVILVGQGSIFG
jgi:hypothetical protein